MLPKLLELIGERFLLKDLGMLNLVELGLVNVAWELLCTIRLFWDPNYNMFHFRKVEMMPTIEEFIGS